MCGSPLLSTAIFGSPIIIGSTVSIDHRNDEDNPVLTSPLESIKPGFSRSNKRSWINTIVAINLFLVIFLGYHKHLSCEFLFF